MKRALVAVVAMGMVLAGCSSKDKASSTKDGAANAAAHATLVDFLQKKVSKKATDKQASCWADALIDDVGAKEALTVASSDVEAQPSEKTKNAASSALAGCMEPWEMIAMSADAQGQTLTDAQMTCLKDGFDAKTKAEFKNAMKTGKNSDLTEALFQKCTTGS